MKIEVSNGELVDKITILEIKKNRISDQDKVNNILKELTMLKDSLNSLNTDFAKPYNELLEINTELWDIEERIRQKEKDNIFDDEFISLARNIYKLNDTRGKVKRNINLISNSAIIEEKSHY